MKYMLMIYHNADAWNALAENEQWDLMQDGGRKWEALVASGEGIVGEPLAPAQSARIVRVQNGVTDVTDGPFAEAKEQFVGFLLLDVASQERAEEIAASWPDARVGAVVVRQINVSNASL
jgi:hypothetical protein